MWEVLERFHALSGRSRASIAVEFLGTVTEQMSQIADILEQVRTLELDALQDVEQVSREAVRRLGVLDEYAQGELEGIRRTARKPPSSNTGVTNPHSVPIPRARKAG
jgi:hypothetical protein